MYAQPKNHQTHLGRCPKTTLTQIQKLLRQSAHFAKRRQLAARVEHGPGSHIPLVHRPCGSRVASNQPWRFAGRGWPDDNKERRARLGVDAMNSRRQTLLKDFGCEGYHPTTLDEGTIPGRLEQEQPQHLRASKTATLRSAAAWGCRAPTARPPRPAAAQLVPNYYRSKLGQELAPRLEGARSRASELALRHALVSAALLAENAAGAAQALRRALRGEAAARSQARPVGSRRAAAQPLGGRGGRALAARAVPRGLSERAPANMRDILQEDGEGQHVQPEPALSSWHRIQGTRDEARRRQTEDAQAPRLSIRPRPAAAPPPRRRPRPLPAPHPHRWPEAGT
mmetsp:Transcript_100964/g.324120  ORF Transcript_100964/g.324120 Transcript_100964/m.324120 type:complete len:340 (+) Transcript_100964:1391-2410(+)